MYFDLSIITVYVRKSTVNSCRANQWTGFYMITAPVMKETMV